MFLVLYRGVRFDLAPICIFVLPLDLFFRVIPLCFVLLSVLSFMCLLFFDVRVLDKVLIESRWVTMLG